MSTRGMRISIAPSRVKAATGLTMAELECVVAVASCPPGELATREGIRRITGAGRSNLPSILVERGVLRRIDTVDRVAVYGVAIAWLEALGLREAEGTAAE